MAERDGLIEPIGCEKFCGAINRSVSKPTGAPARRILTTKHRLIMKKEPIWSEASGRRGKLNN